MDISHSYVVIIAGGAGTRLWPVSRQQRPKQFQAFVGDETLLQHMVSHSQKVVAADHIFIMATPEFVPVIQEQVPQIPKENLLFEPARRDNGPAITLAMLQVHQRDPQANVALLWSDHLILQGEAFIKTLKTALAASQEYPTFLVTLGAKPLYPDPSLGYIHMGDVVRSYEGTEVHKVHQFVEKPSLETATAYVDSGEYLWNLGYKIMSTTEYLKAFRRVQPDLADQMDTLESACKENSQETIASAYEAFPKLSIEHMFTPFLTDLLVVPGDLGWSDIGSWNVLHDVLKLQEGSDVVTKGDVIDIGSQNSLVIAKDRLIAVIGVKDLIVVDDGDAILVMDRAACQDIKKVIPLLEENHKELL